MRRSFFRILPLLILLVGIGAMVYLSSFKTDPPRETPKPQVKIVQTRTVMLQPIATRVTAYGRLRSVQPVMLYSEVTGPLEQGKVSFQPGQTFRRGDLLLTIDDRQIRLDINTAKSELLTALATVLPEIRVDFPEAYEVWQSYFNTIRFDAPMPDLPEAANQKIKLYLSRFNVYKLYFAIRDLEILHEKHFIRAPFAGSIISADLRVGSNARAGTKLGQIINLEQLEAEMPIPAADLQWIDTTRPVTLTSSELPGQWSGMVRRIGKTIDTRTQTVQVYIVVDEQDEQLYDGVFMQAEIPGRVIPAAVEIPRKALYANRYVYVVVDGRLDYRPVSVVRRQKETVIASAGLKDGELLVTELMQGVAPGMLAEPRPVDAEGTAP